MFSRMTLRVTRRTQILREKTLDVERKRDVERVLERFDLPC